MKTYGFMYVLVDAINEDKEVFKPLQYQYFEANNFDEAFEHASEIMKPHQDVICIPINVERK